MRTFLLLILLALAISSCNRVSQEEINNDVTKLVEIEKQVLDLTLEIQKQQTQDLVQKRDSLGTELQKMSNKYQQKYYKLEKTKEFQETYQKIKPEIFTKK